MCRASLESTVWQSANDNHAELDSLVGRGAPQHQEEIEKKKRESKKEEKHTEDRDKI